MLNRIPLLNSLKKSIRILGAILCLWILWIGYTAILDLSGSVQYITTDHSGPLTNAAVEKELYRIAGTDNPEVDVQENGVIYVDYHNHAYGTWSKVFIRRIAGNTFERLFKDPRINEVVVSVFGAGADDYGKQIDALTGRYRMSRATTSRIVTSDAYFTHLDEIADDMYLSPNVN